jgi:general secretion pathway protein D
MSPRMNRPTDAGRLFRSCLLVWYVLALIETSAQAIDPNRWKSLGQVKEQAAEKTDPAKATPQVDASESIYKGANVATPNQAKLEKRDNKVRLYYIGQTWSSVLQDVADKTGSTLILHDCPPGRFSRQGGDRYTRSEAVTVLNRELEPMGYRILEKGDFLTVIEKRRTAAEYRRPAFPNQKSATELAQKPVEPTAPAQPFRTHTVTPVQKTSQVAQAAGTGAADRRVSVAQFTTEDAAPNTEGAPQAPAAEGAAHPMEEQSVSVVPKKRTATDLAKQLFKAFEARAELVDAGPQGLPAFRAYHPATAAEKEKDPKARGPVWFVMEIDQDQNTLWIHGDAKATKSLSTLIDRLDQSPQPGEATKVVAGEGQLKNVAEQLQPQLDKMAQSRPAQPAASNPQDHLLNAEGQTPAPGTTGQAPVGIQDLIGNLKGEVNLQSVGDLDVIVITGAQKDVEAVAQVIKAIERMTQGTNPGIHLQLLKNVDSESLATLLTEVYEQLGTIKEQSTSTVQRTKGVTVIAVGKPNAVLVVASPALLEGVLTLIDELDQPVDPRTEVEIFRLKHAIATQIVTHIDTFYETRVGLGTKVIAIADARTNSIIVQAKPNELTEVAAMIKKLDRADSGAVSRVHRIKLNYAVADDLAAFLTNALQGAIAPPSQQTTQNQQGGGGAQAPQELRDSKSVILEFLAKSDTTNKLVRSGLLSDIRFNPDLRTNTLIITAPEQSIPFIEELVALLDQPSATIADIKIFPLKNADATAAVELLNSIFAPGGNQGGNQNQQNQQLGLQIAGAEDPSSTLIPLKFGTDVRSNSVIAIGGLEALRTVEALLIRLDMSDSRNRKSAVYKLRNSPAADVANSINQFLLSQRELTQLDPGRVSTSEILDQEVIVTPEPVSNSLLISATPRYFDEIMRITQELDREPAQVVIQALLVEVQLENTDEFGVELGFQDNVLFKRSAIGDVVTINQTNTAPNGVATTTQQIISQSATPGFFFNNNALGNNPAINTSQVGKQGLSNFSLGRTNSDLGFGGLVLSASSEAVSVLIRALSARRNVRVLSRPQIQAVDNQLASIQVGQVVPVVSGFQNNTVTGTANPLVEQQPAGIILTVTPRISPEGQIVMQVAAEKSIYRLNDGVPLFTDPTTGNTITSPIKDVTMAQSTIKVPDGQTVVLGGMITSSEDVIERKVPWLGDVPILGTAFRFDSITNRRTELLIFLTPRIIHCPQDMEILKQVEADRMHFLVDEAEAIHGPLFATPEETFIGEEQPFGIGPMPGEVCPPQTIGPAEIPGPLPVEPQPALPPQFQSPKSPVPTPPPAGLQP